MASTDSNPLLPVLASARRKLLETGTRNRLVHVNRENKRSNSLNIVNEQTEEVYRLLRMDGRRMHFKAMGKDRPNKEDDDGPKLVEYVAETDISEDRMRDDVLETPLGPEALARRILRMAKDAKTAEEEQGLNILFLAMGFLRWKEDPKSEVVREAPLILLPVEFIRNERKSTYDLKARDEDITTNLPLKERLRQDFGIVLPEIDEEEEWSPAVYLDAVAEAVSGQAGWSLDRDGIQLGFFSFAKLLMHHDLDLENWPEGTFDDHPLLQGLLLRGFEYQEPIFPDGARLDEHLAPADIIQVVDADASQTKVIEEVRRGLDMVVQGPPGTGKSQTITNILAAAAHDGKTVLFVAEKMAALSVVHARLLKAGLRDMCLELHSRTANKKAVAQELGRTLSMSGRPTPPIADPVRLKDVRDDLNRIAAELHAPVNQAGDTAFEALSAIIGFLNAGTRPPSIPLQGLEKAGRADRDLAAQAIRTLLQALEEAGPPERHPFKAVRELNLQPTDRERLKIELAAAGEAIEGLLTEAARIADIVSAPAPRTLAEIGKLADGLAAFAGAPQNMPRDIAPLFAMAHEPRLVEALDAGTAWQDAHNAARSIFSEAAWSMNTAPMRAAIVAGKASFLKRWFGPYKRICVELASVLAVPLPKDPGARLALVDQLMGVQALRKALAAEEAWLQSALQGHWRGEKTPFGELITLCRWLGSVRVAGGFSNASQVTAALEKLGKPAQAGQTLLQRAQKVRVALDALVDRLKLDLEVLAGEQALGEIRLPGLASNLASMADRMPTYPSWVALRAAIRGAKSTGAGAIAEHLLRGQLRPDEAVNEFLYACAEARWAAARQSYPNLDRLRDLDRHRLAAEFGQLERDRIKETQGLVRLRHGERIPRGTAGEMGVIRGEIGRRKGHKPIRWLMKNAGSMVQRIKPIMLMSPISVAQYLPAGSVQFDLLVIDEASQIRPEDALGCIARARQVVVVGDQQQLPPTSFFDRMVDDDDNDEDDDEGAAASASDMESILTLFEARGVNKRMLSWHYRSRDPSLIRVSNAEFYDDGLVLPPSPLQLDDGYGLKLRRVAGVYAPKNSGLGRAGTNRIEAEEIARAVAAHARRHPDLSLGVVAFSKAQSDMITEVLENARRTDSVLDRFLQTGASEEFFVKNIENVQGDERDVIMISVGYGPQVAGGRLTSMGFGPINGEGGGRRLNVLFSRARTRCEVFTSFDPADIDPGRASRDGLRILKRFLDFAKTGIMDEKSATGLGADSPFEEDVAKVIRSFGFEADPQVGTKGFRLDIGVRHPDRPAHYILAVECDGAAYHSALWARERDRLRQEVLESLGWRFHRIWSTDWFHRRDREIARLRDTLNDAQTQSLQGVTVRSTRETAFAAGEDEEQVAGETGDWTLDHLSIKAEPYRKAEIRLNSSVDPHAAPVPTLASLVRQIVDIEGPIHLEEVGRRISAAFGKSKAGSRIQTATDQAVAFAIRTNSDIMLMDRFVLTRQQSEDPPVRDRSATEGAPLKAEYLPHMELEAAARLILRESGAISRDDHIRAIAKLLGYQRVGPDLSEAIGAAVDRLTENLPAG